MPTISVPCDSCGAAIRFGRASCPACGALVSPELRRALEARLEASDSDFRELKQKARSASSVVLVLGALHLGLGAFIILVDRTATLAAHEHWDAAIIAGGIVNGIIGIGMMTCFVWSRRAPGMAVAAGLAIWISANVVAAVLSPLTLLSYPLFKLIALGLLVRGIVAAVQATSLRARVALRDG
jgi:hypothetical protein